MAIKVIGTPKARKVPARDELGYATIYSGDPKAGGKKIVGLELPPPLFRPGMVHGNIFIESDGTSYGTKVYDADGNKMKNVSKVEWSVDAMTGLASAVVTFVKVPLRVIAKSVTTIETERG